MSSQHLEVRELAAWGFDHPVDRGLLGEEQLRNAVRHAHCRLAARKSYAADSPISVEEPRELATLLASRHDAVALSGEFDGLVWDLSMVDLRRLIAFQRRIGFPHHDSRPTHRGDSPRQLLDLALPLHAPSKSPYMEVAYYRGRWFLRDGYHRSFRLLNQSVYLVPCIVVYAESLAEMGAVGTRFFSLDALFSEHPPMVTDFLDEEITVRYCRALPEQVMPFTIQPLQKPFADGGCQQEVL
jgi:hypothetical protein